MQDIQLYYPKELSWLSFNERVLQEAADKKNPIVERMRFLGIYSNNMDEFFRVRVSDVRRQITIYHNSENERREMEIKQLLDKIQDRVIKMTQEFERIYKEVVKRLAYYNILLIGAVDVNGFQKEWLDNFFKNKVLRHIAPILIDKKTDLVSRLQDSSTYLIVQIQRIDKSNKYAVVEVPTSSIPRFIQIPPEKSRKKKYIILLDDIIKLNLERILEDSLTSIH